MTNKAAHNGHRGWKWLPTLPQGNLRCRIRRPADVQSKAGSSGRWSFNFVSTPPGTAKNKEKRGKNMKEYKTVAGPQSIQVQKGNTQSAFDLFADIINSNAKAGWQYHSMETITVTEKPGCFQQPQASYYYMLIFERDV